MAIGLDATGLLLPGPDGGQWWDPGVAGRRKRHIE